MADEPTVQRDAYDRVIGAIDGLPDVHRARPTTVTSVLPIIGKSQTFVVQTYATEDGNYVFLQMIDAEGRVRIALPPKVTSAIYRQQSALVKTGRRNRARDRWDRLTPAERKARTSHLRPAAGG